MENKKTPFGSALTSAVMVWSLFGYLKYMLEWYNTLPTENIALLVAFTFIGLNGLRFTSNLLTTMNYIVQKLESLGIRLMGETKEKIE